jgi:hypothetical protein
MKFQIFPDEKQGNDIPKQVKLEIYSDANWAEDETDRKSNSGYISFFAGLKF